MYMLHATCGISAASRIFTTFQAASLYGRRMAARGWIVTAITKH